MTLDTFGSHTEKSVCHICERCCDIFIVASWKMLNIVETWKHISNKIVNPKLCHFCQINCCTLFPVRSKTTKNVQKIQTLPEAQRTQGIASKLELSLQLMVAPPDGATCMSCTFSHQLESLSLPHCVGAYCISSKFGHQMAPLA